MKLRSKLRSDTTKDCLHLLPCKISGSRLKEGRVRMNLVIQIWKHRSSSGSRKLNNRGACHVMEAGPIFCHSLQFKRFMKTGYRAR